MKISMIDIDQITPYENNPRNNEAAIDKVKKSIQEYGIKQPIVIDKDNVIIAGHTRYRACLELGIKEIPCVVASDLTPEQARAYRLVDNKTSEFASWDFELLQKELAEMPDFDFSAFDFQSLSFNAFDDVSEGAFSEHIDREKDVFTVSFNFDISEQDRVERFIKANGKDVVVAHILDFIRQGEEE